MDFIKVLLLNIKISVFSNSCEIVHAGFYYLIIIDRIHGIFLLFKIFVNVYNLFLNTEIFKYFLTLILLAVCIT